MKDTSLVSGVELAKTPLTAVKALRGFFDESGQARSAGDIVLCSERVARGLIAANKAERTTVEAAPALEAATPNSEPLPEPEPAPEPEPEPEPAPPVETRSMRRARKHEL